MKDALLKTFTSPAFRGLFGRWADRTVPIVMLHRFSVEAHPDRVSGAMLASSLRAVREAGLRPWSLGDLAEALAGGSVPPRSICFTVDDGYLDFEQVAHPVFRRFDVPVTVFLTTAFVDGTSWNWWDRIRFAFERTRQVGVDLLDAHDRPVGDWTDRSRTAEMLMASCKEVGDEVKQRAIARLEQRLEVEVPARPVGEYAAMDWEAVARLSAQGVEFGAHTVSHPILSRVDDERQRAELETSIAAVRRATGQEARSFAYPNGKNDDFDERTIELLREQRVTTAVTTEYGIVSGQTLAGPDALYRLPRVELAVDPVRRRALFTGLEAAKIALGRK